MDPDPGHEHSLIFPEFFLTKQNCQKISSFFSLIFMLSLDNHSEIRKVL